MYYIIILIIYYINFIRVLLK